MKQHEKVAAVTAVLHSPMILRYWDRKTDLPDWQMPKGMITLNIIRIMDTVA